MEITKAEIASAAAATAASAGTAPAAGQAPELRLTRCSVKVESKK